MGSGNAISPPAQSLSRCVLYNNLKFLPQMKLFITTLFVVFCLIFIGCNGQQNKDNKMEAAKMFVSYLEKNDTASIYRMCYITSEREKELRLSSFELNRAHEFFKKHGVPDVSKWIVTSNPNEPFEGAKIIIPIFSGIDTTYSVDLLKADLVIFFPPAEVSKKIYRFELNTQFDLTQIRTVGPKNR